MYASSMVAYVERGRMRGAQSYAWSTVVPLEHGCMGGAGSFAVMMNECTANGY